MERKQRVYRECWLCGCLRPFFLLNSTKFLFPEYFLLLEAILMGWPVWGVCSIPIWGIFPMADEHLEDLISWKYLHCCSSAVAQLQERRFSGWAQELLSERSWIQHFWFTLPKQQISTLFEWAYSFHFLKFKNFPPACGKTLYNYDSHLHLAGAEWGWTPWSF